MNQSRIWLSMDDAMAVGNIKRNGFIKDRIYDDPLIERVTIAFTKRQIDALHKHIRGKQARSDFIRELVCGAIGIKYKKAQ